MKKIGVIGGMGPMATQLFYKMVTENTRANNDQEHINMIILSDAQMPDRTAAILSDDEEKKREVYERLLGDALFLQSAGCDAILITCNTAHYFANMITEAVKLEIPILHMINLAVGEVVKDCNGDQDRVAILATDGTIKTGLYQRALEAEGVPYYIPSTQAQSLIMHEIYDCIKSGKCYDEKAWKVIESELKEKGCKRALMACTELSVIKADNKLDDFYIDPMEVLAYKTIEFSGATKI